MLYGSSKRRQMARSILPSTARRSARAELAHLRRSHRRATRATLTTLVPPGTRVAEAVLSFLDDAQLPRYPTIEIGEVVGERRGADKLGHFIRWATAVTVDVRPADRLSRMRALLPDGLIGAHALSHLAGKSTSAGRAAPTGGDLASRRCPRGRSSRRCCGRCSSATASTLPSTVP
jgi:hypothetical protein